MLNYIDICSGISAPTMAWHPLGWRPLCFAEIEAAPRAVLAYHYPDVPLHGDFTELKGNEYGRPDLLVGGTPCQSFSVAGLRGGMADSRGNLALEYCRLADRAKPRWLVWENVPGVLSSDGGRCFGSFLGALAEIGYGFAYAVLDAQHFGVPQRRRRVFVVGYLGDWRRAAAVLFERHSLQGHSPPRRETGKVAPTIPSRGSAGGGLGTDFDCDGGLIASTGDISHCLNAGGMGRQDYETETLIAHSLRGEGFDAREDGTGRGTPLVPVAFAQNSRSEVRELGGDGQIVGALAADVGAQQQQSYIAFTAKDHGADAGELSPTLRAGGHSGSHANAGVMPAVAFSDVAGTLKSCGGKSGTPNGAEEADRLVGGGSAVRRLTPRECERLQGFPDDFTPRECERLQGFPDDFTLVPYRKSMMADGPRYKMLGNSMAVPVVRWIGERIQIVDMLFD